MVVVVVVVFVVEEWLATKLDCTKTKVIFYNLHNLHPEVEGQTLE